MALSLRVRARSDAAIECVGPGEIATGFRELESSLLEIDGEHWQLEIDDEPLAVEHHAGCSRWVWTPGFYAGEVRGRLLDRERGEAHALRFDVSPTPAKLGRERFAELLAELRRDEPQFVFGSEPTRARMGSLAHLDDPLLAYAKLHAHAHEFLASLARVVSEPVRRLRQERRMLAPAQIRRSDARTALAALRSPQLVALLGGCEPTRDQREVQLDAPVVEPHVDEAANRCMKAMATAVLRRVVDCHERLASAVAREKEAGTRTSLAARWPLRRAFLQDLELRLRKMLHGPLLMEVSHAEVTAAGLNTIAAHPIYARSYKLGWRCLGLGFEGEAPDEALWLPPTWELYERWCFVAMRRMLQELGFDAVEERSLGPATHAWQGSNARGSRVWLGFQVRCTTWSQTPAPAFRSLSVTRYPDLVLTYQSDDEARWFVFDAKYRASRSAILDAMTSAHLYHDSLRWHGRRPELSLLLVPASKGAPWLEAQAFRDEHHVGVVALAPDQRDELARVLAAI